MKVYKIKCLVNNKYVADKRLWIFALGKNYSILERCNSITTPLGKTYNTYRGVMKALHTYNGIMPDTFVLEEIG